MRALLSTALFLLAFASAHAQTRPARLDSIELVRAGFFKAASLGGKKDDAISTGEFVEAKKLRFDRPSTVIPAKVDTLFGVEVRGRGRPNGGNATVRVRWLYPPPGIKNPATGQYRLKDEFDSGFTIGKVEQFFWSLGDEFVLVPGPWVLELWQGETLLFVQQFQMVK